MSKLNVTFIASVLAFSGKADNPAKPDKNGKMPVILNVVAGKCPNTRVISGTVAERAGLITGKAYLVTATERDETYDNGGVEQRQFNFTAIKEVDTLEIIKATHPDYLGQPVLINVVDEALATEPQGAKAEDYVE